jgi:hypothetical protein
MVYFLFLYTLKIKKSFNIFIKRNPFIETLINIIKEITQLINTLIVIFKIRNEFKNSFTCNLSTIFCFFFKINHFGLILKNIPTNFYFSSETYYFKYQLNKKKFPSFVKKKFSIINLLNY